jgi:hypothetical protein
LEAARTDIGQLAWASAGFINAPIAGTGSGIGTGRENTRLILATDLDAPAALATRGGYNAGGSMTDWFLPSTQELILLWEKRDVVGGFGTGTYWSSMQGYGNFISHVHFNNGGVGSTTMDTIQYVRAIRAF